MLSGTLVHRSKHDSLLIEIRDQGDLRSLYFGSYHLQSQMSLSQPETLVLSYTRFMTGGLLFHAAPRHILIIGVGSGSFVRFFHHHYPKCSIDAVDSSAHVIDLARGYFQLPDNEQVRVFCADGLDFIKSSNGPKYDLILVDAFDEEGMSATIYNDAFFAACAGRLNDGGILSANLWSGNKKKFQDTTAMISQSFAGWLLLPIPGRGNIVILAMHSPIDWKKLQYKKKDLRAYHKRYGIHFEEIIKVARSNNLTLPQRLRTIWQ